MQVYLRDLGESALTCCCFCADDDDRDSGKNQIPHTFTDPPPNDPPLMARFFSSDLALANETTYGTTFALGMVQPHKQTSKEMKECSFSVSSIIAF